MEGLYIVCLGFRAMAMALYSSVMLLSYSISSGALGSPDFSLSCFMIALALHNTIILIITPTSFYIYLVTISYMYQVPHKGHSMYGN